MFFAEIRHARVDRVADLADLIELFFMRALCLRRIGKGPVQTLGRPGKIGQPAASDSAHTVMT